MSANDPNDRNPNDRKPPELTRTDFASIGPTYKEMSAPDWEALRELPDRQWDEAAQAWEAKCPACHAELLVQWRERRVEFLCLGVCTDRRVRAALLGNQPLLEHMSEVQATKVSWLWQDFLALGKLALLDGDPSLGKTTLMIDLAARLSNGLPMPGCTDSVGPAGVLLVTQEDGAADTIKPRLDAAGANSYRVKLFTTVHDKNQKVPFMIPENVPALEKAIRKTQAKLVVIDPIMGFLQGDSHRDQDMKRSLSPLAAMAERTGACVVMIRHLRKSAGPAMYRGSGAIGIAGTARIALMIVKSPDGSKERLLGVYKSNIGEFPKAWRIQIAGEKGGASHVEWLGQTECDLDQVLAAQDDPAEKGAVQEACAFLREALKDGPVKTKELERLGREAGISPASIKRAAMLLGTTASRDSEGWTRALPAADKGIDRKAK